mmetsp:Transcript_8646/g.10379  ORF Transcript_8646/g.10379 Transcript_8646/m.10379 type:complete len:390 (-) Transcript_8646:325-1494(-)
MAEHVRGSRCLLFLLIFVGLGSFIFLGGLVGYYFVLNDFLSGDDTKQFYLLLIAVAIIGSVATITALCGLERRRKCTLVASNVLLVLSLVGFTGLGFITLLLGNVRGLAEVYTKSGTPMTELKVHFVRSVFNDCCVSSGFGGTPIPICGAAENPADVFCIEFESEYDQYVGGLSEDICPSLEDYTNSSGFRVGEVAFGLCANGNGRAWTTAFTAFIEDRLAAACFAAFSMACVVALSIVALFYVICFINVTFLPYVPPNHVAPQWETIDQETGATFSEGDSRQENDRQPNSRHPRIYPQGGANPFDDGEIENATSRRSFFRFRRKLPVPDEEETSDGTEEEPVPRRLESISTDASGRFVVDDVSHNDFPNDMDFSDDESDGDSQEDREP